MNSLKALVLYSKESLKQMRDNFYSELVDFAKNGKRKTNSLKFLDQEFIIKKSSIKDKKIQVFSFGGSNFEKATINQLASGIIQLTNYDKLPIPIMENKEVLLELILEHLDEETEMIGVNFAFPAESVSRGGTIDARILTGAKEHKLNGIVGEVLGEIIEKHLLEKLNKKVKVSVANDTSCLLLSDFTSNLIDSVGLIVGTGYNIGLFLDGTTLVNTEAGFFEGVVQSLSGKIIDSTSQLVGKYLNEKELAGKYLYRHYNIYLASLGWKYKTAESTEHLTEIANGEKDYSMEEVQLARYLFQRSASLAASNIAAIYDFKNQSKLNLIVEGGVFWKGYNYKNYFTQTLDELGVDVDNVEIKEIEKSALLGAGRLII